MRHNLRLDRIKIWLRGELMVDIDAEVPGGEVLALMGPSGAGKSTLLAFIAGFLDPAFTVSGRVILDNVDVSGVPAEQRRIGLLFQDPLLLPHLSVAGNVLFGIPRDRADRTRVVERHLAELGLGGLGERDPATLSGGQKARVALLRTMMAEPSAVLLDEPFSRLDSPLKSETRAFVFEMLKKSELPTVIVTHDDADARAATFTLRLTRDQGIQDVPVCETLK